MGSKLSLLTWLLAPLCLIPALPPTGGAGGVHDDGQFFSADAIAQSQQVIRAIHDTRHRDVLVETIPDIPQEQQDDLQKKGKARFWYEWADARAKASGISGVYILICKDPAHLQVAIGNQTAQRLFTVADRDELVRRMTRQLRQKQFDQALIDAVGFIRQCMDAHATPAGSDAPVPTHLIAGLRPCFGDQL